MQTVGHRSHTPKGCAKGEGEATRSPVSGHRQQKLFIACGYYL